MHPHLNQLRELHQSADPSLLLLWNVHIVDRKPRSYNKLFKAGLLVFVCMGVHDLQRITNHSLYFLALVELFLIKIKVFSLKILNSLAFSYFIKQPWPREVIHVLRFQISHEIYNLSIVCESVFIDHRAKFGKGQSLFYRYYITNQSCVDDWLDAIDELTMNVF